MKTLFIALLFVGSVSSCQKKCECTENWDSSTTYIKNDMVSYDGKCWKATAQGRGIVPGPWLQNGNDIWEICND